MSKIKLLALGGLEENGKNLYYLEYNNSGIIIDVGIGNYDNKGIGVDSVIPDLEYLNKKNIVAVLISHGHIDQMGAINHLLKVKPNLKIYASDFTVEFLKLYGVNSKNLNIIKYDQVLKIENFEIESFKLSHAVFGNYGYLINTPAGAVMYSTDYNFNQTVSKNERTDIEKIIKLKNKYKIKVLMTEVLDIENEGVASSAQEEIKKFRNIVEYATGRIIISLYSSNVSGINNIIEVAEEYDKKICIIGRDLLNYVNVSRRQGYITHSRDRFKKLGDIDKINPENQIIIVSGLYEEPFSELASMALGKNKFVKIKKDDTVIIASKAYDKIESYCQEVKDDLARTFAKIIHQKLNIASHAQKEDIKMMINLVEPNFVMPIKGEYRKQIVLLKEAEKLGYKFENIIIASNGNLIEINEENYKIIEEIQLQNILVKSSKNKDQKINNKVINDRELLSTDGYVTVMVKIDKKTKKIIDEPLISSGGIIKFDDDKKLVFEFQKFVKNIFDKEDIDLKKKQIEIRIKGRRFLENKIQKAPMILIIFLEVE